MDGALAEIAPLLGGRWKPECPVVRQVVERSDAIGPEGVCCALQPEHSSQQHVYQKDKQ